MSVNIPNQDKAYANPSVEREESSQSTGASPQFGSSKGFSPFGMINSGSVFGQVIPEGAGSEKFNKLVELMKQTITPKKEVADSFDIIPLDREVHTQLHFSVVVVVRNNRTPLVSGISLSEQPVVAQVLVVESSNEALRPVQDTFNTRNPVTVDRTSEDAYNQLLVTYVLEHTSKMYNGVKLSLIDPLVIPRELDTDNKDRISAMVSNVTTALNTDAIQRLPGFMDWSLEETIPRGNTVQLPTQLDFAPKEFQTYLGHPVFRQVDVEVGIEATRQGRADVNDGGGYRMLSSTNVFVEFVPINPSILDEFSSNRTNTRANAAWAPRLRITNISHGVARTVAGTLEAIASVSELNRDRNWARIYRQDRRARSEGANMFDIGGLNYEANLEQSKSRWGVKPDTQAADFDDRAMGVLLDRTVTPRGAIAIDCPVADVQSWYTSVFATAIRGSEGDKRRATDEIIKSGMRLTSGNLDKHFDTVRGTIFSGDGELQHMGYWVDNRGNRRDLREWNYLSVANAVGDTNPDLIVDWVRTWLSRDQSEVRLMADRLEILRALTDGNMTVTGTALVATFSSSFADGLVRAIADTGVPLVSRNMENGDMFTDRRATADYMTSALMGNASFSRGQSYNRGQSAWRGNRYN